MILTYKKVGLLKENSIISNNLLSLTTLQGRHGILQSYGKPDW